jgi:hypothetical protein
MDAASLHKSRHRQGIKKDIKRYSKDTKKEEHCPALTPIPAVLPFFSET